MFHHLCAFSRRARSSPQLRQWPSSRQKHPHQLATQNHPSVTSGCSIDGTRSKHPKGDSIGVGVGNLNRAGSIMVVPRNTTITGPTRGNGSTPPNRSPLQTRRMLLLLCRLLWQRHGRSSDRAASLRMPSSQANPQRRQLARSIQGAQPQSRCLRPAPRPVARSLSERLVAAYGRRPTLSRLLRVGVR